MAAFLEEDLIAALVSPEPAVPLVRNINMNGKAVGHEEVLPALNWTEDLAIDSSELAVGRLRDLKNRLEVEPIN